MKILFLTPHLPLNSGSGGSIRSYQIYENLRQLSTVDILCCNGTGLRHRDVAQFKKEHRYQGNVRIPWVVPWFAKRKNPNEKFLRFLERNQYDYIVVRYYWSAFWFGLIGAENIILDCDDCPLELEIQKQNRLSINKRYFSSTLQKIKNIFYKKRYLTDISRVPVVTFSKKSHAIPWKSNFVILPNKIQPSSPPPKTVNHSVDEFVVVFVGTLSYGPNFEGLDHFICNIWPSITAKYPRTTLKIVGGGLPARYRKKWGQLECVKLCGFVENIDEVYSDAHISISPIFTGSGTHIKIIESLLHSTTMVISKLAHRGYEKTLMDGKSLYVASDDQEYIDKIFYLIKNPRFRKKMERNGKINALTFHAVKDYENDFVDIINIKMKNQMQTASNDIETYISDLDAAKE
ncbi:glycosyltransferase family 4 protein [Microbulbifer bruguierae]|uniref:Glycosyltransferase family 4 protein n=1 Tax=Microbulbifer bruguierae TaxID=3029061 RepID=A0ABY8NF47_9GAMM|nr:glycosyltransferase family 4 protein [Microbulbifer bruguierae]WGL17551.1 glycosyltransferase family 4 protein [Microbulbifer bruguierae]